MVRILVVLCAIPATLLPVQVVAQGQADSRFSSTWVDTLRVAADSTIQLRPFARGSSIRIRTVPEGRVPEWEIDAIPGVVRLLRGFEGPGSLVRVRYEALALGIATVYRLEREPVQSSRTGNGRPARPPPRAAYEAPGLRSSGSISRGLIAGSNRDVAVESGLRLELDGEVAPGVSIRASLTDADSPIRPDGTTQRLSEFDRVFIELSARPGRVLLGDFDARLQQGTFSRFSRKLQGVQVQNASGSGVRVVAVGATSQGQLRSQPIAPIDGVQGPYRLEGPSGERFILVLPGTERVYLDGRLLQRGESADYTIDYTTGEVSFSARQIISSDRRILIEFEYSTNQFTRTLVGTEFDVQSGAFSLGGTFIREADTGDFLSEFGLTAADSLLLAGAGDGEAFRSGAQPVVYDPEARYVQYTLEVTSTDSFFVALKAQPPVGTQVYRVQFVRVGEGLGRYVRDAQAVNGISYAYRGPGLGSYEPLRRLPTPQKRSLLGLRGGVEPIPGLRLAGEWAGSLVDLNRLSPIDDEDDQGAGLKLGAETPSVPLGALGSIRASGSIRRTSANFSAFERYRPVEFARDWNLTDVNLNALGTAEGAEFEREMDAGIIWSLGDSTHAALTRAALDMPGLFEADRTRLEADLGLGNHSRAYLEGVRLDSRDLILGRNGTLDRSLARLNRRIGAFLLSAEAEHEDRRDGSEDSLAASSIRFTELRPGVAWKRGIGSVSATVERRSESWALEGRLQPAATSWTLTAGGSVVTGPGFRNGVEIAYRTRTVERAFLGRAGASDTRALLLNMQGAARTGALGVEWLYDARTERTPVLQELFLRTGPELGAYVWVDDNGDNVIQLDELLPESTPNEGIYIRTFLPSDSLASVNAVRARLVGRLRPPSGSDLLGRLAAQTLVEVEERSRTGSRADVYLLQLGTFRQPGLTTNGRFRFRQDLSLRPVENRPGLDLSHQEVRSLTELASGVESRLGRQSQATVRQRVGARTEASVLVGLSRDQTDSERFASRRFDIYGKRVVPAVTIRSGARLTTRLSLEWARKEDRLAGLTAALLRTPASVRISASGRSDVVFRAELSRIRLDGPVTSGLAAFELTDGRGAGRSAMWGVTAQWSLNASLRATLAYDGRAPSGGRTIHTGRMQLSAVF